MGDYVCCLGLGGVVFYCGGEGGEDLGGYRVDEEFGGGVFVEVGGYGGVILGEGEVGG